MTPQLQRAVRLGLGLAMFTSACANRVLPPPVPGVAKQRASLRGIDIHVRRFHVDGAAATRRESIPELQDRFLDYIESTTAISDVYFGASKELERPTLILDTEITLDQTTRITYLLDLLAPLTAGLFTPWWGNVEVSVDVAISDAQGRIVDRFSHRASAEFEAYVYSWFRTEYVERAYQEAYREAFSAVATRLADSAPTLRAAAKLPADGNKPTLRYAPEYGGSAQTPSIVRHSEPSPTSSPQGPLAFLSYVGGVEFAGVLGVATVRSEIVDSTGVTADAEGEGMQLGWRVALYTPPANTGFFWYPVVAFRSQQIEANAFEGIPMDGQSALAASACSDSTSGEPVSCTQKNAYRVEMNGGLAGVRVGYAVVFGGHDADLFLSAGGSLNLLEYRRVRGLVAGNSASSERLDVLRSFAIGTSAGVVVPDLHLAFRFVIDYEYYLRFAYAGGLQMLGPAYDRGTGDFARSRINIDDTRLGAWSFQFATALTL